MNVLYANPTIYPTHMASAIQILNSCLGFHNAGYNITLYAGRLSKNQGRKSEIENFYGLNIPFELILFKKRKWRAVNISLYSLGFLRSLYAENYDVVYTRSLPFSLIALVKVKNVFYEIHDLPSKKRVLLLKILYRLFRNKKIVISSPSKSLLRYYTRFVLPSCHTLWVPHGSKHTIKDEEHSLQDNNENNSSITVASARISDKNFCCVYVGSMGKGKGLDFVLRLASDLPDVDFDVAVLCDSDFDKEVLMKTSPKNVKLHYNLNQKEVKTLYKKASALLLPVQKYTGKGGGSESCSRQLSPLRAYEYLSAEKPIIASNIWPNIEVFSGFPTVTCLPLESHRWVKAVNKIKENKINHRVINGAESAKEANQYFSWERRAKRIVDSL